MRRAGCPYFPTKLLLLLRSVAAGLNRAQCTGRLHPTQIQERDCFYQHSLPEPQPRTPEFILHESFKRLAHPESRTRQTTISRPWTTSSVPGNAKASRNLMSLPAARSATAGITTKVMAPLQRQALVCPSFAQYSRAQQTNLSYSAGTRERADRLKAEYSPVSRSARFERQHSGGQRLRDASNAVPTVQQRPEMLGICLRFP